MPKVSVIVPIYNVEIYIEKCVRSLFEQTLDDIEYIFVNDCTQDNSMKILEKVLLEYPHRKPQVNIFNHEKNQGQAGARATGMKAMTGEYMIHCDPDDWVELNMYETMYNTAKENNSDLVVCNFYKVENNIITKSIQQRYYDKVGITTLLKYNFWCSLWNNMIKSSIIIIHDIYPIYGINYGEDLNIICRVLYYKKIEY